MLFGRIDRYKVSDKRYDKYNFLIHDYFFAKSLDKLRPGGVMALVTSKGTMDKENSNVRKYIAQRAELLGAIRLPNDTFKGNAGTEVVSDILFLQKRDRLIDIEPDWVHLDTDENGIRMNSYFVQHPEMILGEMKMVSGRFGPEATCEPFENADLSELLNEAVSNIHGEISEYEVADELEEEDNSIPADPMVRNFSYTVLDDKIYFRENSRMSPVEVSATAENRIKGMIGIRDCVRNLIELQTEDYPDSEIKQAQDKLNTLYDSFTKKYGLINSRANTSAFSDDSSYALLSALEVINEDGELERKADMFFKRTIKPHKPVTEVDTADEALAVSMGEKAAIDMEYMMELSGKSEEELFADLKGVIFLNPLYEYGNSYEPKYLMADEYLSGNVREKLATAKRSAALYPEDYTVNVQALEKVQPKDLTASEISVRLGATWIPPEIFQQFMFEFLDTPRYAQWNIKVACSLRMGEMLGLTWDCIDISEESLKENNASIFVDKELQRVNRDVMEVLDNKDIIRVFPRTLSNTNTSLVLKTPKTKTSVRKIFLPSTVAQMLLERKKQIDEMKELFGDEYLDYDLVFCHSSGRPMEGQVINRALKKLIQDNDLPDVVFHSFRHASITYKLKWNGGDMKSVQGDSGHARMDMVADVYSHIIDEDRRYNAQKFEEQFYNAKGLKNAEEGKTAPMPKFETSVELLDPMAEVQKESEVEKEKPAENSTDENAALLTKLLSNPETAALLKALAKTI